FLIKHNKTMPASWEKNQMAGEVWLKLFMKRHPILSLRSPQATNLSRATSFNKANVNLFFKNYTNIYNALSRMTEEDLNNYNSHVAVKNIEFCKKNGIILLTFSPHCIHKLQSLDYAIFGSSKKAINSSYDNHIAMSIRRKLLAFDWDVLPHPPSDHYLFLFLKIFFETKKLRRETSSRRICNAPAIAPLDNLGKKVTVLKKLMQTSVKTADCLECSELHAVFSNARREKRDAIVDGSYANHDGGDRKLPRRPEPAGWTISQCGKIRIRYLMRNHLHELGFGFS
ncbi:hypothetical protein ALC57_09746, partial [Trachymyrmex cornetzi]